MFNIDELPNYSNKEGVPNDLATTFQRKYTIKLKYRTNSWISIITLFNKSNTNMRFFIPDAPDMLKAGFFFRYYKNVLTSPFFSKELRLNSITGDKFFVVNQFDGIKNNDNVRLITNETITLGVAHPKNDSSISFKQTCTIYVFKDMRLPDNSAYYVLVERQHNDIEQEKKIVKTMGLELTDTSVLGELDFGE